MNPADLESVDEQLTAYLDGELSAEEASRIENRLVDDEGLRVRLAELRKAYDLLDELPETPHNQRFTRSTLELVIKDLSVTQSHVVNEQGRLVGVAACANLGRSIRGNRHCVWVWFAMAKNESRAARPRFDRWSARHERH